MSPASTVSGVRPPMSNAPLMPVGSADTNSSGGTGAPPTMATAAATTAHGGSAPHHSTAQGGTTTQGISTGLSPRMVASVEAVKPLHKALLTPTPTATVCPYMVLTPICLVSTPYMLLERCLNAVLTLFNAI